MSMAYGLNNKCTVPKIFITGQFQFNLSSKTWSHVFGAQCRLRAFHAIAYRHRTEVTKTW